MRRAALLLCSLAGLAAASGLDVPAVGSPFSGPAVADPAALYWNPALLVRIERPTLSAGLGVVLGRLAYERDRRGAYQHADHLDFAEPVADADLDPSRTGKADEVTAPVALPAGDLFLAWPVADRVAVGAGVYTPYAAPVDWPQEGDQRFALRQAFIAFTHVSGGLSVQITETLAFGGSLSYVHGTAALSRVQDFAALDTFGDSLASEPTEQANDFGTDAPSTVRELDVLGRPFTFTDAAHHGATFNLGLAWAPTPSLTLGLTYDHGYEASLEGDFALDMSDPFFTDDLAPLGMRFEPLVEGRGTLGFDLPQRVMFGAAYDVDAALALALRIEWVRWGSVDALRIELVSPGLAQPDLGLPDTSAVTLRRDWVDAVHVELGGRHALDDDLGISAALGYQSPASPDETIDAASPDRPPLHRVAGGPRAFGASATLKVDAELQGILPRTVTSSAHDLGNGTYNLFLALVSARVELRFGGAR